MYIKATFNRQKNYTGKNKFRGIIEHPARKAWNNKFGASTSNPPAHVRQLNDKNIIQLYVPGFEKSDFRIALQQQKLSISVDDKQADQHSRQRQEYTRRGFVSRFSLNETIDPSAIHVGYERGVLTIILPKTEAGSGTTR